MSKTVVQKIIEPHLVDCNYQDAEWAIKVDQTLTQDATGTMAYLQFEALNLPLPQTELSVSYVDHNISETGTQAVMFLESFADKYGILFSGPGNGICHQVHLERFARPGKTLLGSDSHTPTAGGMGALAIGVGGLNIAAAMAGKPFYLSKQKIIGVELTGELSDWVSAKDIILEVLRRLKVKGGLGAVIEYYGDGVKSLTVPERATITNMGAELGATSSVFPSDQKTLEFLKSQKREKDFVEIKSDAGAVYDETLTIALSDLEPMIACPSMPDKVCRVSDVAGTPVGQVIIGSCTNSSYRDLSMVASVLKSRRPDSEVELNINPGSSQVTKMLDYNDLLEPLRGEGSNLCSSACLGCIGMGQEPPEGKVSLRTFNRNFKGRSGDPKDQVYLCSPETAVAAAVTGKITVPSELGEYPDVSMPEEFPEEVPYIQYPTGISEIIRGELIAPLPVRDALEPEISGKVLIKTGDDITTDDIMPAGKKVLPFRAHIPKISEFVFNGLDPDFPARARENGGGFIVGGENYGQGSSREHAALAPMYLGVKAVLARSFARIHKNNLINFGILPLEFSCSADYESIEAEDVLSMSGVIRSLKKGEDITVKNETQNKEILMYCHISERDAAVLMAGGLLSFIRDA